MQHNAHQARELTRARSPAPQNHETNVAPGMCASNNSIAQQSTWPGPDPNNTYGDDCGGEAGVATFVRYAGPSTGLGVFWYVH